jgi:rhodanese-related sulfurtransferase
VGLLGGHGVTEISPAQLQAELTHKDFTLLNVKTPYIGEIEGTDLWIPYDQLAARTSELPADKAAKIVVYCRTGNESSMAVQTLTSLGYTNLEELSGGMTAWTAAGGTLVSVAR